MNTQQQDQSSKSEKTAGRKRLSILGSTGSIGTQTLQVVDELADDDCVHESFGTKLIVDRKSLVWLEGTEIDFVQEGDANGFDIRNPNVKRQCGCGDSFYV